MKTVLTKKAKRELLKEICARAFRKYPLNGKFFWESNGIASDTILIRKIIKLEEKEVGVFRRHKIQVKKEIAENLICIKANSNPYYTLFTDTEWNNEILIKSYHKKFDKIATYIANELSNYAPNSNIILSINTVSATMGINPSKRSS